MDEQKEKVTSYDPKTGNSKDVTIVMDHDKNGGMKLSVENQSQQQSNS